MNLAALCGNLITASCGLIVTLAQRAEPIPRVPAFWGLLALDALCVGGGVVLIPYRPAIQKHSEAFRSHLRPISHFPVLSSMTGIHRVCIYIFIIILLYI